MPNNKILIPYKITYYNVVHRFRVMGYNTNPLSLYYKVLQAAG